MAKKTSKRYLTPLRILLILVLLIGITFIVLYIKKVSAPIKQSPTASISPETSLLVDAAVWYPSAPWSTPAPETRVTTYGKLVGESIHATVTSDTASLDHFEQVDTLKKMGFVADIQLNADGPGSSSWGYVRPMHNTSQIMLFSYITTPTGSNPNEPLQFTCPCKISVNVFVSKPF